MNKCIKDRLSLLIEIAEAFFIANRRLPSVLAEETRLLVRCANAPKDLINKFEAIIDYISSSKFGDPKNVQIFPK